MAVPLSLNKLDRQNQPNALHLLIFAAMALKASTGSLTAELLLVRITLIWRQRIRDPQVVNSMAMP